MGTFEQGSSLGLLFFNTLQRKAGYSKGCVASPFLACGTPLIAPLPQALYLDSAWSRGPAYPKLGTGFTVESLTAWDMESLPPGSHNQLACREQSTCIGSGTLSKDRRKEHPIGL